MPDREPAPVLVLAPNWLGDSVMALPAIADVRRHFPLARLMVAARGALADLFAMVPGVDEVITLTWRGSLFRPAAFRADVARIRAAGAGVAILLPNSFASAWLVRCAGVPERWGFATDWRGPLLSRAIPAAKQPDVHQARYYGHLVRELGIENGPLDAEVRVPAAAVDAMRMRLATLGWNGTRPLIAMAPGAAYGTAKRWLPSYYARLADELVTRYGSSCVLVGSAADRDATRLVLANVSDAARPHVIDVAGGTDLEALAGVFRLAHAAVSNDSGAMHLAAAAGCPVVAIFGPTRERETAPLVGRGGRADVLINPVSCRPCMLRECPIDHRCMTGLTPADVLRSVIEVLNERDSDGTGRPEMAPRVLEITR